MAEVSIVIVCMNRPDILFPCLDSIRTGNAQPVLETLVVAYQFSPENLAALQERYPWVTVVLSDGVRGFSENNNLALRQVRGKYCFVLNDDTTLPPHTVGRLVEDFGRLPDHAAAIAPRIVFPDGRVQTCGRSRWTPWRYFKHYLHLVDEGAVHSSTCATLGITRGSGPSGRGREATVPECTTPSSGVFQTYTVNGACFLIKTEAFKSVGWFDERFFFTPEDIALGHALNEAGYTVWADPDVQITHYAGRSVSAMEQAIKPARVRGSMIFYGEPFLLKAFVWCFEALRACKYFFLPRRGRNLVMRRTALNVMQAVFSNETPKELFIRFKP